MEWDPGTGIDESTCYAWGTLFASPWAELARAMASRAEERGLVQEAGDHRLDWKSADQPRVRFLFIDDPSDFETVRRIYTDESNARVPDCFVIVRQPDESETRGEVVFDIFRLSPKSYLWHFHRVYTPPEPEGG